MFLSIQHKKTETESKGDAATYTYTIVDSFFGEQNVSFSMPFKALRLSNSYATLALYQAYAKYGKEAILSALAEHYALLRKEGYDTKKLRVKDIAFYREGCRQLIWLECRYLCNGAYDPLTKKHPLATIVIQASDPEWSEAYERWLLNKPPTDSPEWKKGVYLGSRWNG